MILALEFRVHVPQEFDELMLFRTLWDVPETLDIEELRRLASDPDDQGLPDEDVVAFLRESGAEVIKVDKTLIFRHGSWELRE